MARRGLAWRVKAAEARHGRSSLGGAWLGMAAEAWRGLAGPAPKWRGVIRHGLAKQQRHGEAWQEWLKT